MRTLALALALVVVAPGCKWKKEAERLSEELAASQQQLQDSRDTVTSRETTIGELEAEVAELEARIGDLQGSLSAMEADLDAQRERNAQILADRGALRNEVRDMKQALAELQARKEQAEARVRQFKDLVARFQSLIDAGKLDVRIVDGRMVVVLGTDVLFASGSADLSEGGAGAIAEVAAILASIPDRRFQVEGHTDDVPIHTQRYPSNWFLAAARAIGVVNSLVANGMAAEDVSAAAFADTRPVAANDTDEGRAANRRIEIVVVPDLSDLPGYEELSSLEE
ncbi:MAG: OmpA family protein [Alphaproteobacteria bacterium]|nr:OmpA family protein [Alphaproteobacteria bacterium]